MILIFSIKDHDLCHSMSSSNNSSKGEVAASGGPRLVPNPVSGTAATPAAAASSSSSQPAPPPPPTWEVFLNRFENRPSCELCKFAERRPMSLKSKAKSVTEHLYERHFQGHIRKILARQEISKAGQRGALIDCQISLPENGSVAP